MTLVAGRMPSLHTIQRHAYGEDPNTQGILKSGPTRNSQVNKKTEPNQKTEDGKRLVRFCDSEDRQKQSRIKKEYEEEENQDIIMFGSNMYFINKSDPNSAVRKLFPNSKLTPLNPFINRLNSKNTSSNTPAVNTVENNRNLFNGIKSNNVKNDTRMVDLGKKNNGNIQRRQFQKVQSGQKPKPGKTNESPTPLIERIKQLTCNDEVTNESLNIGNSHTKFEFSGRQKNLGQENKNSPIHQKLNNCEHTQEKLKDVQKTTNEGLNLVRYNQSIPQTRPQKPLEKKAFAPNKTSPTDEARRTFLSSLSLDNESEAGDKNSVVSRSTTPDTSYSLSDIEEALTDEEKEIKEAFSQENKQDELELFVQQDAGRTERLRKRYSSTPKPDIPVAQLFSNINSPLKNKSSQPQYLSNSVCNIQKDKPKFGSTIEILQQLQQQIETPYQLEGRRTACSNYSDSSIPISERLFCDESSDGYEPVLPKQNVHRTCSLDSKNYEEIDNYPSAFYVPRTKSHEHPYFSQIESNPYFCPQPPVRCSSHFPTRIQPVEQNFYTSSPDLHNYHLRMLPDRVTPGTRLHPVLQRQYCRYPINERTPRPAEEGKILTPPVRMHTYMNVPANAQCYPSPPIDPEVDHYLNHALHPQETFYHSNVYQNVPQVMAFQRLCTERERGVPEGASSQDSSEYYPPLSQHHDRYFSPNLATIPKPSSLFNHYCVDV